MLDIGEVILSILLRELPFDFVRAIALGIALSAMVFLWNDADVMGHPKALKHKKSPPISGQAFLGYSK